MKSVFSSTGFGVANDMLDRGARLSLVPSDGQERFVSGRVVQHAGGIPSLDRIMPDRGTIRRASQSSRSGQQQPCGEVAESGRSMAHPTRCSRSCAREADVQGFC